MNEKKDQLGMDVLRITETNLMGILHGCHFKTHTHTCVFSMYSYTIDVYVLYGPCLLSNQTLFFISPLNFAGQATIIRKGN